MNIRKIMYLPGEDSCVWDINSGEAVVLSKAQLELYETLFGLSDWRDRYAYLYEDWLKNDNPAISDITDPINIEMIQKLDHFNRNKNDKLYYWFDVDRCDFPDFKWELCPLSNTRLIDLGATVFHINRMISPVHSIMFPI